MAKVLKADATSDICYAQFDFSGGTESEVWIEYRVRFDAACLAFFVANGGGQVLACNDNVGSVVDEVDIHDDSGPVWASLLGGATPPTPTADAWHIVKLHHLASGTCHLYVDGNLVISGSDPSAGALVDVVALGLTYVTPGPDAVCYYDDIKVGTTEGGTDLFEDDFESGDLSAWTTSFGDVTVIDDPFASASSPRTFEGPRWSFWLAELGGAVVACLDSFASDRQASRVLGEAWSASATVPADDPRVYTVYDGDGHDEPLVAEGVRVLLGFRETGSTAAGRWEIAWTGPVLQVQDTVESGVPVTHLSAWDLRKFLEFVPVVEADGTFDDLPLDFSAGEKANVIARTVLENAVTNLLAGTPLENAFDLVSGEDEDCAELEMKIEEGLSVAEVWDQLEATGAIDIVLDPVYDPLTRPGALSVVNFLVEKGTERNAAIFAWDLGPRSLVSVSRLEDGTKRANNVQFYAGQGATPANRVVLQTDAASVAKFGPYWSVREWPDQTDVVPVTAFAATALLFRKDRQTTVTASPTPARSSQAIQDYDIGDRAPLYASQQLRKPLAGYVRVYGIPFVIGDDAMETIPALLVSADGVA